MTYGVKIETEDDVQMWKTGNEETEEYDAIHAAAGAVLAGAEQVMIVDEGGSDD